MSVTDSQPVSTGNLKAALDALLRSDDFQQAIEVVVKDTTGPLGKSVSGKGTASLSTSTGQYFDSSSMLLTFDRADDAYTTSSSAVTVNQAGKYLILLDATSSQSLESVRLNSVTVTMTVGSTSYSVTITEGTSASMSPKLIDIADGTNVTFKTSMSTAGVTSTTATANFMILAVGL